MNIWKEGVGLGSFALRRQSSTVEPDDGPPLKRLEEAFERIYGPGATSPQTPGVPVPEVSSAPLVGQGGTSQVEGEGAACAPCSADHFSTVAGGLSEALRFARTSGVQHPQVLQRISLCFDELNIMERIDAAPSLLESLSDAERELMRQASAWGRDLRHEMSDIKSVEDLESVTGHAQKVNRDFRSVLFKLQFSKLSPEEQARLKVRAREIIEDKLKELG